MQIDGWMGASVNLSYQIAAESEANRDKKETMVLYGKYKINSLHLISAYHM